MTRLRFRSGDQSRSGSILLLALGAIAGVAVGMALAGREGDVFGLRARLQRRVGRRRASAHDDMLESMRMADGAADDDYDDFDDVYEHEFDDESGDEFEGEGELADARHAASGRERGAGTVSTDRGPTATASTRSQSAPLPRPAPSESELEARVLDVFQNDPTLRGQAIDIGAIGPGVVELTGWVQSAAEVEYADTLAGGVLDVVEVMNSLAVRGAEESRVGAARADR